MNPGPVFGWLVLLLSSQVEEVRGLQCYSCNYNSSLDHCDHFSPQPAWRETCPPSSQTCLVTRGHFQSVSLLTRECGGPTTPSGCRTRQLGGGVTATICSCNTDLCNLTTDGAGTLTTNTIIIPLLTLLYFTVMSPL